MNNIRRGFTMIELIFVIVIIGILAGVAVPKLSATRDDAVISKSVQEVQQSISEIGAYYTAHGKFGKWKDMTNVHVSKVDEDFAGSNSVTYSVGKATACVKFASNADSNITVTTDVATIPDKVCTKLVDRLNSGGIVAKGTAGTTYAFGGSAINY